MSERAAEYYAGHMGGKSAVQRKQGWGGVDAPVTECVTTESNPYEGSLKRVAEDVLKSEGNTPTARPMGDFTYPNGRVNVELLQEMHSRLSALEARISRDDVRIKVSCLEARLEHALTRIAELEKRGVSPVLYRSEVERLKGVCAEQAAEIEALKEKGVEAYDTSIHLNRDLTNTVAELREKLDVKTTIMNSYWSAWKACIDALGDLWKPKKGENGEDCAARVIRELKASQANGKVWEGLHAAQKELNRQYEEALSPENFETFKANAKLGVLVRKGKVFPVDGVWYVRLAKGLHSTDRLCASLEEAIEKAGDSDE